jgi:hypothetical protein
VFTTDRRPQLQQLLAQALGNGNVYFQPPPNIQMKYPAIVYQREQAATRFADDAPYTYIKRYQVMVIDRDPDSPVPDRVAALPMTTYQRWFAANGLNHDVFIIYF